MADWIVTGMTKLTLGCTRRYACKNRADEQKGRFGVEEAHAKLHNIGCIRPDCQRPYGFEYSVLVGQVIREHLQDPMTYLRTTMEKDVTASIVFAGTTGWRTPEWDDRYQQLVAILTRFDKVSYYLHYRPPPRPMTEQAWLTSDEGLSWTTECDALPQAVLESDEDDTPSTSRLGREHEDVECATLPQVVSESDEDDKPSTPRPRREREDVVRSGSGTRCGRNEGGGDNFYNAQWKEFFSKKSEIKQVDARGRGMGGACLRPGASGMDHPNVTLCAPVLAGGAGGSLSVTRSQTYATASKFRKLGRDDYKLRDFVFDHDFFELQPLDELSCLTRATNLCLSKRLIDHSRLVTCYTEKCGHTPFDGTDILALITYLRQSQQQIVIHKTGHKKKWLMGNRGKRAGGSYLAQVLVDYSKFGSPGGHHFIACFPGHGVFRDPNFTRIFPLTADGLKDACVVSVLFLWRVSEQY
jgi:hypothetical protein